MGSEFERCLKVPRQLTLKEDGQHVRMAVFLQELRGAVKAGDKAVRLDFRGTDMVYSDGTLLFYSELSRLRDMYPATVFLCTPSKSGRVNQVLQHLGIFALLSYRSSVIPQRSDVVTWRTASSKHFDSDVIGELIEAYPSLVGPRGGHLFRSASEAMGNAVRHAYLESREDGLPDPAEKKWWMFMREDENEMTVAICDLGIGIPRSLPIKYAEEVIQRAKARVAAAFGMPTRRGKVDAHMIHAAMEIDRTRTNVAGRGKGLTDLRRIVDEVKGGRLVLISNRGRLVYSNGVFSKHGFERSIKGTLVLWTIPLS